MTMRDLDQVLHSGSVALIGAPDRPGSIGAPVCATGSARGADRTALASVRPDHYTQRLDTFPPPL